MSVCVVCVCVCVCRKIENKVMQNEEFNMKESRHYNVSVLIYHRQDLE